MLVEYRGAKTRLYPWPLTKADELNGTKFRGLATLRADAHRYVEKGKAWSSWQGEREPRRLTAEFFGTGMRPDGKEKNFTAYWPDVWAVMVEKREGQWFFTSSSFPTSDSTLDLDSLPRAAPASSCSELMSAHPGGAVDKSKNSPKAITLPGLPK